MEFRVSDVKKWAGREETAQLVAAWPEEAQARADYPLIDPAVVDVVVRNAGGGTLIVQVSGQLKARALCSRCAEPFETSLPFEATEEFREEAGPHDESLDYSRFAGDAVVLDRMVSDAVGVSFPITLLCQPQCRGLCTNCGANWNLGPCDCQPQGDSRWAALENLFPDYVEWEREKNGRTKA